MLIDKKLIEWDYYTKKEIIIFVIFFLIVPLISDIEYSIYEKAGFNHFKEALQFRIIWGFFSIMPYFLFYKFCIYGLLIKKKKWHFIVTFIVYTFLINLYNKNVIYTIIANMPFLPEQMIKDAKRIIKTTNLLRQGFNYIIHTMLPLIGLAYYINYEKQRTQIQALKELELNTNLKYLKAQLEPHFFFNTMNNIYALALKQSEQTAPMVAKLSDLMRYVLNKAPDQKVPLAEEINFISSYIEIEKIRYNNRNKISFEVQGINNNQFIEPLLLLPYIENTFKHGVEEETTDGFINIVIYLADNELTLSTQNSKPKKENEHKNGLGMINAKKRLELLYPNKHNLVIEESATTFSVLLTIQL